ncbi:RNA polymerase sigma factor [Salmonirosea aquatica]|uniref:Sigma-70 family RNA polymerase sigma factor n=1 Tax=Salmonirosea aquatica TaxID=2654236 RepID=A0A7C9BPA8_9BACT|nr:sigma-70 family RNA polymerase sigma factor [Cytophagaceae bacterium SJW1-29]
MNSKPIDEKQLWQEFQAGSHQAFQQLHQYHIRHLLNYGLRIHGSLSAVEDCIQDVFVQLWHYRQGITRPTSVRFYLLRALRNQLRTQYRRDRPFVSGWDDDGEQAGQNRIPFDTEPSAEDQLISLDIDAERKALIHQTLQTLTARQREIIYLRYFNDLTYEEICEVMQVNYQTARSQIYTAIKLIRKELKDSDMFQILILYFLFQ